MCGLAIVLGIFDADALAIPVVGNQLWATECTKCTTGYQKANADLHDMEEVGSSVIRELIQWENRYLASTSERNTWFSLEWKEPKQSQYRHKAFSWNLSELYLRKWSRFRFAEQLEERRVLALLLNRFVRDVQIHLDLSH